MKSVFEMVTTFRSVNPEGKSVQEYQEICRNAIAYLRQRTRGHYYRWQVANDGRGDSEGFGGGDAYALTLQNKVPYTLRQTILPALKKNHWLFANALHSFKLAESAPKPWYEAFLDILLEMDDLVEQATMAVISIWDKHQHDAKCEDKNTNIEHLTRFRAENTEDLMWNVMKGVFDSFLNYAMVFTSFDLLKQPRSEYVPTTVLPKRPVPPDCFARIANRPTCEIDRVINWLQKPLLDVSRADWQGHIKLMDEIWLLLQTPIRFKGDRSYISPREPESEPEDNTSISQSAVKFAFAAIPVIQLCRIYFNKLSRPINSAHLIFVSPSMEMGIDQLKLLLKYTQPVDRLMKDFEYTITRWPTRRREGVTVMVNFIAGFSRCSKILKQYWDALLDSHDPRVDQDLIFEARQWLDTWTALFLTATRRAMDATGHRYSWPPKIEDNVTAEDIPIKDAHDEDVLMED